MTTRIAGPDEKVARPSAGPEGRTSAAVYAGATLAVAAALAHLWVAPEHFGQWWAYGVFFLGAGLAQGACGVLLLRWPRSPLLLLAGIGGNLGIVSMYLVSRTVGIPLVTDSSGVPIFGPHAGKAEEVGLLDFSATAAELGLVVCLVTLLPGAYRRWTVNALLLVGGAIWALRLLGVIS